MSEVHLSGEVEPEQPESYFICATPRSGSTLLCGLLDSSGNAGHPASYFRRPDLQMWANRWKLPISDSGVVNYKDYVDSAVAAGSTDNGVFAARIMWGTLDEILIDLGRIYPEQAASDTALLDRAFGRTRYVYVHRVDVVAQAVSWFRAEQTGIWHLAELGHKERPVGKPRYDFNGIRKLVEVIKDHNAGWKGWFASVGVKPYEVVYEDLENDPFGVAVGVLDFLRLANPGGQQLKVKSVPMGDELNFAFAERYKAEELHHA